jgi:hypothetical protein
MFAQLSGKKLGWADATLAMTTIIAAITAATAHNKSMRFNVLPPFPSQPSLSRSRPSIRVVAMNRR